MDIAPFYSENDVFPDFLENERYTYLAGFGGDIPLRNRFSLIIHIDFLLYFYDQPDVLEAFSFSSAFI